MEAALAASFRLTAAGEFDNSGRLRRVACKPTLCGGFC